MVFHNNIRRLRLRLLFNGERLILLVEDPSYQYYSKRVLRKKLIGLKFVSLDSSFIWVSA